MKKTKQNYREQAKETRKTLDIKQISTVICGKMTELNEYKNAKIIAAFYPCGSETDITPLFEDKNRKWYLPVLTDNENMEFRRLETRTELTPNKYGIHEPCSGEKISPEQLDLIIIPALAVDKHGHRLGYGKGYYDRFLAKLPDNCAKIVPIADELIVKILPVDEYDVAVDIAVSEKGIYYFK